MKTVLFFGDSLVNGYLLADPLTTAWPRVIEAKSKGTLRCLNGGKNGRPTDSFDEFSAELARWTNTPIDLFVVALGTNDSRDLSPDCASKAAANVGKMLDYARTKNILRAVVVSPPNINRAALGPTESIGAERDAQLRHIGQAYHALAKRKSADVRFADAYGAISPAHLAHDGVHPDAAGHHELAERLYPVIAEAANAPAK